VSANMLFYLKINLLNLSYLFAKLCDGLKLERTEKIWEEKK
jgi:hypothetical protein